MTVQEYFINDICLLPVGMDKLDYLCISDLYERLYFHSILFNVCLTGAYKHTHTFTNKIVLNGIS